MTTLSPKTKKKLPPNDIDDEVREAKGSRGGGGDAGVHTRLAHGAKWGGRVGALSDPITKHRPLLP